MKRPAVEISRYKHADVSSAFTARMRGSQFTGVARRARDGVTRRDPPRRRAVVERALELRRGDDVDVTWHGVDAQLVVGRWRQRTYGVPVGDVIAGEYELVVKVKACVVLDSEVVDVMLTLTAMQ